MEEKDIKKPETIYHGSPKRDIEKLIPQNKRIRSEEEGPVVFGTHDKAFASMFLGPRPDDSWSAKGSINGINYILIDNEERFKKEDIGGTIYELSGEPFEQDLEKGMKTEWLTKSSVIPSNKKHYDSTLDAMIENGVQVYFVKKEELKKFKEIIKQENTKNIESFLKNLNSENKKRKKN